MKTNRPGFNWVIDAALFAGFLACFFMDLTGLDVHQWLGVAGGALAAYHLLVHWKWVKSVTVRLFGRTSAQARLYYAIDAGLLLGLAVILVTGLVISTWLTLPLDDPLAWIDLHVAASVATLLLTAAKIALHWRWIVSTARRSFGGLLAPAARPAALRPAPAAARLGRREFLTVMGAVGITTAAATVSALRGEDGAAAAAGSSDSPAGDAETVASQPVIVEYYAQEAAPAAQSEADAAPTAEAVATEPATASATTPTAIPEPTATVQAEPAAEPTAEPTAEPAAVACTVRCNKGCSFPGRCRRYRDANDNGRCDLGECL